MSVKRFIPESIKGNIVLSGLKMGRWFRKLGIQRIKRDGVAIDITSPLISDHYVGALFWRVYEWGERRAIRAHLLSGYPVVELGASIGFISCLAAGRTPNQKQLALEANPALLPLLRENIARNHLNEKIEVIWAAVDYGGSAHVILDLGSGSNLGARVSGDGLPPSSSANVMVPATTLGKLLSERQVDKYTLICDIEGAEAGLLDEAPAIIAACQQMIIEFHKSVSATGEDFTPSELGEAIAKRWGMTVRQRYNEVWVLQR